MWCFDKVQYLSIGWPGLVHDQRGFQNSTINKVPASIFLLENTKYGGWVVLFSRLIFFNDLLSSLRTNIRHTLGIWKGRFPFLRSKYCLKKRYQALNFTMVSNSFCSSPYNGIKNSIDYFKCMQHAGQNPVTHHTTPSHRDKVTIDYKSRNWRVT